MPGQCEFSEFTYGYVFTEERMQAAPIRVAPLFPTLRREKQAGYDVDIAGFGFVQFKRPETLIGSRAKERQHKLTPTIFRMHLTNHQHYQLLQLAKVQHRLRGARVFYACPAFSTIGKLNEYYRMRTILQASLFVEATSIGPLSPQHHHLSYDERSLKRGQALLFSDDPTPVPTTPEGSFNDWISEVSRRAPMTPEELSMVAQVVREVAVGADDVPGISPGRGLSEATKIEADVVSIARAARHAFDAHTLIIESR